MNDRRRTRYDVKVKPYLKQINNWACDALTNDEIAYNLGIALSTFQNYLTNYPELQHAVNSPRELLDQKVEKSLYKRAVGFAYKEKTWERKLDPDTNTYRLLLTKVIKRQVIPDVGAQQFWLINRRPAVWQTRPEPNKDKANNQEAIDTWLNATKLTKGSVSSLFDNSSEELTN